MATEQDLRGMPVSRYHFATSGRGGFRGCTHPVGTRAPTGEMSHGAPVIEMKPEARRCEPDDLSPDGSPIALTGRQKVALMLVRANYTHAQIAAFLGLKNRISATKLIARARKAKAAADRALADFLSAT